ncbi:hypothetical protein ACTOV4_21705 [Brucella sp. C7-11G]
MTTIFLNSAFEEPPEAVQVAARRGTVIIIEQENLTAETLIAHQGLITGSQLDQNAMLAFRGALARFLDNGGRWFFSGHMVRALVDGLDQYRPLKFPKRRDFDLTSINPHPIYDGIDLKKLETNRCVAGFYGRGCNPLPENGVAINGLGAAQTPVDWLWKRPGGGRLFSHAGNDLNTVGVEWGLCSELLRRVIAWTNGGPCLALGSHTTAPPAKELPLADPETFQRSPAAVLRSGSRIIVPSAGTYYHIRSFEGPAFSDLFDVISTPEDMADALRPHDILWVPCRTPAQRMIRQQHVIRRHLEAGGVVVALGESRSDLWLPNVEFTSVPTNWWWWLTPGADLGVELTGQGIEHPLMQGLSKQDITWHLHGWFAPPPEATVLVRNSEGRAIFYIDTVSTAGTMILSSLDPIYHHGSHFMPATTRFLERFAPNLRTLADA